MKEYIEDVHGFEEENMTILLDDGVHEEPTRDNILNAYKKIVRLSKPGDVVFCHYAGTFARIRQIYFISFHSSSFLNSYSTSNYLPFTIKGHGGKLRDQNGDEADGYDETLVPVDYQSAGQIRDDDLLKTLVVPMAQGVVATSVMDCCHSGTVLDLPYNFKGDGEHDGMEEEDGYDFDPMDQILAGVGGNDDAPGGSDCCVTMQAIQSGCQS